MCNIVVINNGEKEIETPRQFYEHFGFMPDEDVIEEDMDNCLCPWDIEGAFNENNIQFTADMSDYYVTEKKSE